MEKHKAVKIELERAEGPAEACCKVVFEGLGCWDKATAQLRAWSATAPKMGYDKCDFIVTYDDGNTYDGRYDNYRLDNPSHEGSLADHVAQQSYFMAGKWCPAHMTAEQYEAYLREYQGEGGVVESYQKFIDEYEIPSEWALKHAPKPVTVTITFDSMDQVKAALESFDIVEKPANPFSMKLTREALSMSTRESAYHEPRLASARVKIKRALTKVITP